MKTCRLLGVSVLFVCGIAWAQANTMVTDPGTVTPTVSSNSRTLGFDFTVGSTSLLVTALGLWDENQDGFNNSHSVGLWDNAGNLLGSVVLSSGTTDPLLGQFRYVTLTTPVTLLAGMTYVLGGSYLGGDADHVKSTDATNPATFDPAVTPGTIRFSAGGSGFAFPDSSGISGPILGPNAEFSFASGAVPETGPGMFLCAVVFVALFWLHRRRPAVS
jgi:Domain of unknown function (DUF4082)